MNESLTLPSILQSFTIDPEQFRTGKARRQKEPPIITGLEMERTDFGKIVKMPPNASKRNLEHGSATDGFQINKFRTSNKCYLDDPTSTAFINSFAPHATPLGSDIHNLLIAALLALQTFGPNALVLDLGTGVGKSANTLASVFPYGYVYSFDSFKGLAEAWPRQDGPTFAVGTFAVAVTGKQLPFPLYDNVPANEGPIANTLPPFCSRLEEHCAAREEVPQIALLHVDTDLYGSAVTALTQLELYIGQKTILVFDEFYGVKGFLEKGYEGEYMAFKEFIDRTHYSFRPLTFNALHEQMTIQIGEKLGPRATFDECNLGRETEPSKPFHQTIPGELV